LAADTPTADDYFGQVVAIDADTIVVGAYLKGGTGAAYAFAWNGSTWDRQTLTVTGGLTAGDGFGYAVAIDGDRALVGAPGKENVAGTVYEFTRSGGTWTYQRRLDISGRAAGDNFGGAVALDGDTAVIGAWGKGGKGAVYVFTWNGTSWDNAELADPSILTVDESFGWSVAISGDKVLVGAPRKDNYKGAAYFFTKGASWTHLTPDNVAPPNDLSNGDMFGWSVALDAGYALVGTTDKDGKQGTAYTYRRETSTWSFVERVNASDTRNSGDYFGSAVALNGSTALVGADGKSGGKGTVYTYIRPPDAPVQISPTGLYTTNLTPTYTWNEVYGATDYALLVYDFDTSTYFNQLLYTSSICTAGSCSATPSYTMTNGHAYGWWVAAADQAGWSPWSIGLAYTLSVRPEPPVQIAPTGHVAVLDLKPTYSWQVSTGATLYAVHVYDMSTTPATFLFDQIYDTTVCDATTCSVKPEPPGVPNAQLVSGVTYAWFVAALNYGGVSDFSPGMVFAPYATPSAPTLIAPESSVPSPVTFSWNKLTDVKQYYIRVIVRSTGAIAHEGWYVPTCPSNVCTTPAITLSQEGYTWYAIAWNPAGYGLWSAPMNFMVGSTYDPPTATRLPGTPPPAPTFVP
jgi:hypothetical protein